MAPSDRVFHGSDNLTLMKWPLGIGMTMKVGELFIKVFVSLQILDQIPNLLCSVASNRWLRLIEFYGSERAGAHAVEKKIAGAGRYL